MCLYDYSAERGILWKKFKDSGMVHFLMAFKNIVHGRC
jgi:hypothetical protein